MGGFARFTGAGCVAGLMLGSGGDGWREILRVSIATKAMVPRISEAMMSQRNRRVRG